MPHRKKVDGRETLADTIETKDIGAEETTLNQNMEAEDCYTSTKGEGAGEPSENRENLETIRAEMTERIKRLQADFDNFRRRTRQEQCDLSAFVTQNLIKELLPVLDNFERALSSRPTEDPSGFASGVEMIYRQLFAALEKQGIQKIEAVGETFDPARHEAIMTIEDATLPEGMIVEELQKGYEACGKLLRPALVKVVGRS